MKDSEVFREARNVLFERGHTKEVLAHIDGSVCLNGACNFARYGTAQPLLYDNYAYDPALYDAVESLGKGCAYHLQSLWHAAAYNDEPETTLDDVLEVLERAEKLAETKEISNAR